MPGIVYYVPTYVMIARWPLAGGNDIFGQGGSGFANEWPALLIPGLVNAYYIFLMRQSFYSIPRELDEAARLDGANTWQILTRIHIPFLKAPITVMVIFQFVYIWNDYLWPLIAVGGNEEVHTVALGFERLIQAQRQVGVGVIDYPFAFALATLALIPTLLLFLFLQRYFVEGVQGFAVK
jgi:multiple sugar transport system permease protein